MIAAAMNVIKVLVLLWTLAAANGIFDLVPSNLLVSSGNKVGARLTLAVESDYPAG